MSEIFSVSFVLSFIPVMITRPPSLCIFPLYPIIFFVSVVGGLSFPLAPARTCLLSSAFMIMKLTFCVSILFLLQSSCLPCVFYHFLCFRFPFSYSSRPPVLSLFLFISHQACPDGWHSTFMISACRKLRFRTSQGCA